MRPFLIFYDANALESRSISWHLRLKRERALEAKEEDLCSRLNYMAHHLAFEKGSDGYAPMYSLLSPRYLKDVRAEPASYNGLNSKKKRLRLLEMM